MKFILFLALSTILFEVNAQCKYKKDEVDRFTKVRIIETKGAILWIGMGANIAAQGVSNGESKYLRIQVAGGTVFSVLKGMELRILTESEDVIILKSSEKLVSNYTNVAGTSVWSGLIDYTLTEEVISKLIKSKVIAVQIEISGDKYIEKDVKKKHRSSIASILKCIS